MHNNIVSPPIYPVVVGRIGKAYGILGWIKIISFTYRVNSIFFYKPWFIFLKSQWKSIYIDQWKLVGKYYIVKIYGTTNRESAKLLTNSTLLVDSTQFPSLKKDEYYWKDIIGCAVFTISQDFIGYVINIISTVTNDILVVKALKKKSSASESDCLIPFIKDKIVKNVNIVARVIFVDWDINI